MNAWLLILAVLFWLRGSWLIPTTLSQANNPLAPYRAILGVIYLLVGIGLWLVANGMKAAVVLGP